jgi:hypothetical protein
MIVRATVTKGEFQKGVEYELPDAEAQAMIIQGLMSFVAVAPAKSRQKALQAQYDTR